jgi:hypothetical protein
MILEGLGGWYQSSSAISKPLLASIYGGHWSCSGSLVIFYGGQLTSGRYFKL